MDTKPTYLLGYLYGPLSLKWKQYLFKSEILLLNLARSSPITTKIASPLCVLKYIVTEPVQYYK